MWYITIAGGGNGPGHTDEGPRDWADKGLSAGAYLAAYERLPAVYHLNCDGFLLATNNGRTTSAVVAGVGVGVAGVEVAA